MDRLSLKVAGAQDHGGFTAIASAPTLDRDDEIIDANAFEPLPASVPVHVDHVFSVGAVVGRGVPRYQGGQLMLDVVFGSDAQSQDVRSKVLEGLVDRVSVGFMGAKRVKGKDGVTHITQAELLEVSVVSIPSNRDARIVAVRGRRPELDAVLDEIKHATADALLAAARAEIKEARAVLNLTAAQGHRRHGRARAQVGRALRGFGIGTSTDNER